MKKIKIFSRNSHSNNYLKIVNYIPNKRRKRKATQILSPKTKNQKKIYLLLLYITTKKKTMSKQTIIESKFSKKKTLLTKNYQTVDEFKTKEKKSTKKISVNSIALYTTTTTYIHISVYKKIESRCVKTCYSSHLCAFSIRCSVFLYNINRMFHKIKLTTYPREKNCVTNYYYCYCSS